MKSGSPCTACASKTRSSFLHLQVERRDIRRGLHHPTFSICDNALPLPFARCCLHSPLPRKLEKSVPETTLWETNDLKLRAPNNSSDFFFFLNGTFQLAAMIHRVGNAGFNRVKRESRSVTSEFLDVTLGWDITR